MDRIKHISDVFFFFYYPLMPKICDVLYMFRWYVYYALKISRHGSFVSLITQLCLCISISTAYQLINELRSSSVRMNLGPLKCHHGSRRRRNKSKGSLWGTCEDSIHHSFDLWPRRSPVLSLGLLYTPHSVCVLNKEQIINWLALFFSIFSINISSKRPLKL